MVKVYVSAVIPASPQQVWAIVRDFNDFPAWHPAITESSIEAEKAPDQIGCTRAFSLADGAFLRERLIALSDFDLYMTYTIIESPFALDAYVATLRLIPVTMDNHTFAEWTAEFDCAADPADHREESLAETIRRDIFEGGINALKAKFES